MTQFLSLRGWDQFQHYRDRSPAWIKLHRELMTSESWVLGTDASRLVQVASMLLAARYNNKIPYRHDLISKVASLSMSEKQLREAVSHLAATNFLEINGAPEEAKCVEHRASTVLAPCYLEKSREEERRVEERREDLLAPAVPSESDEPEGFAEFRKVYPPRHGSHRWRDAMKAWRARSREGHSPRDFIGGAKRYAAHCAADGKTGTQYVMQAATFLGTNKDFLLPWTAAPKAETDSERILRKLGKSTSNVLEQGNVAGLIGSE